MTSAKTDLEKPSNSSSQPQGKGESHWAAGQGSCSSAASGWQPCQERKWVLRSYGMSSGKNSLGCVEKIRKRQNKKREGNDQLLQRSFQTYTEIARWKAEWEAWFLQKRAGTEHQETTVEALPSAHQAMFHIQPHQWLNSTSLHPSCGNLRTSSRSCIGDVPNWWGYCGSRWEQLGENNKCLQPGSKPFVYTCKKRRTPRTFASLVVLHCAQRGEGDGYIDTSFQKAEIPSFPGCE